MLLVIWEQHRFHSIYVILADWFHCDASQKRETNRVLAVCWHRKFLFLYKFRIWWYTRVPSIQLRI